MEKHNSVWILGTTASGKTRLAVQIAQFLQSEIISVDSRQVYRDMDIGTGKDLATYGDIPYHLIDILPAGATYNVHTFRSDFKNAFDYLLNQHKTPVICGGTAMYLAALLLDYQYTQVPIDEVFRANCDTLPIQELLFQLHQYPNHPFKIDQNSKKRIIRALEILKYLSQHSIATQASIGVKSLIFGLKMPAPQRKIAIHQRLLTRLQEGMIAEVQNLLDAGISPAQLSYYGLEYKAIVSHLQGEFSLDELIFRLSAAIYRFSKRQQLFFDKMEREGIIIHWLDAQTTVKEQFEEVKKLILIS